MLDKQIQKEVVDHLLDTWPTPHIAAESLGFDPILKNIPGFQVLALQPTQASNPWVYGTVGCFSIPLSDHVRYEFFLLSPTSDRAHVETLTMLANLHADSRYRIKLGEVINIGRPWLEHSMCDHLLVSLPYPYGPKLEWLKSEDLCIRFLWALPITAREAAFAELNGYERLEKKFDAAGINYLDPARPSVV